MRKKRQWKFFSRAGPEARACGVRAGVTAFVSLGRVVATERLQSLPRGLTSGYMHVMCSRYNYR